MKSIIVVECVSSSVNYINDIRREGYEPIALEPFVEEADRARQRQLHDLYFEINGTEKPRVVMAAREYKDTLEIVRGLNPILIVAGGDDGIDLATHLSADLGLTGNPVSALPAMRDKKEMQEALHRVGLRYIRSRIITNQKEALEFYHSYNNHGMVVLKPATGGATVGVRICNGEEELLTALEEEFKQFKNVPGLKGEILIQEYIDGTEYIVDTLSCHGKHIVTFTARYKKTVIPGYGAIYNSCYYNPVDDERIPEIVDYALKAVEAVGLREGPVHGEYKLDENGPVLIETNCRPNGAMMRADYYDSFLGHHETDLVLKALLHPETFLAAEQSLSIAKTTFVPQPIAYGIVSYIHLKEDVYVTRVKIEETLGKLASFFYECNPGDNRLYRRTIDLSTVLGMVYLSNKDLTQLLADNDYIQKVIDENPESLYETGKQ